MLSWTINKLQNSWVSQFCMTITYYHYVLFSSALYFDMITKSILPTSFETNFEQYLYKLSWSVAKKVRYEIMTINVLNFSHIPHKANITQQEISRDEHITIIKQPSKHIRSQFDSIRIFFEWYVLWNKTLQVEFWRTVVLEARFSWVFHFLDRPTCFEEDLHQQAQGQGFWTSRGI